MYIKQLTYSATSDQSPKGGEGDRGKNILGITFQEEEMTSAKSSEAGAYVAHGRHIKGTSRIGAEEVRG